MRRLLVIGALLLAGCGYSARDGELIGQAKKVVSVTPIVCPDYTAVDISLGVLRNGVGSLSTQDVWLRVMNHSDVALLKRAVESGAVVKVKYDTRRLTVCYAQFNLLYVEILP